MQDIDKNKIEKILQTADRKNILFPGFRFVDKEGKPVCLGSGGSSYVYLMKSEARQDSLYAIKVTGYMANSGTSQSFWTTSRIQRILSDENNFVVRTINAVELVIDTESEIITPFYDSCTEQWEEEEDKVHLRCLLMEKLDPVIEKNKFGKATLSDGLLQAEKDIINMSAEIGLALIDAHTLGVLHRDIKLENILYDKAVGKYKLGDFGMSKYTGGENAETVVYTDGYGAPEIERHLFDSYNETADVYSFGITLYLLFNDLKFPGSDGYYPRTELQYSPDYVFPAPIHASEELARIIRKMCSYRSEDRYQGIGEALSDLVAYAEGENNRVPEEVYEAVASETETYRDETGPETEKSEKQPKRTTRSQIKEDLKLNRYLDSYYSKIFLIILGILLIPIYGLHGEGNEVIMQPLYWVLPVGLLVEALFQKIRELHLLFAFFYELFLVWFAYEYTLTVPIFICVLIVLFGLSELTFSVGLSLSLWMVICLLGKDILPEVMSHAAVQILLIIVTLGIFVTYLVFKLYIILERKFIKENR